MYFKKSTFEMGFWNSMKSILLMVFQTGRAGRRRTGDFTFAGDGQSGGAPWPPNIPKKLN
jgi:hypothetical protein